MITLRKTSWYCLFTLFGTVAAPVLGAQWSVTAGVSPGVSYSDNVCLSADNEQGEMIALVGSNLRVSAVGRRASFDVGASVEVNSLSDSKLEDLGCAPSGFGNRQQVTPRLNANANAEIFEDWFYIDVAGNVDQNEISPFLPGGGDSLNRTGNTNTYARYSVSPYISRRFSDLATLLLRYTTDDETNTEDTAIADSSEERVVFNLNSIEGAASFSWGLQANYSDIEYEETDIQPADNSELSSVQLNLGYQLNRTWQINGFVGQEDNDFVSSLDGIDGDIWDVGVRWTPNSRTSVDLGFGDRFFGATPRFSISHEYKRSTFSADYSRDLTYDRNIRSSGSGQSGVDNPFQPLDPVTGLPLDIGGNSSSLTTSPILDERFSLGYSYSFRRATLRLDASHSDQTRTEDQGDQSFQTYSISIDRSLSRTFTFTGSIRMTKNGAIGEQELSGLGDNDLLTVDLGLQRPISSNMDVSLGYQYNDRRDDVSVNEYVENRVTLTFQIRL